MEAHQEIAKLLRRLAELVEQMGAGIIITPISLVEDPPVDPAPTTPTKWVEFRLQLEAPIGRPKAQRIIDRVMPSPQAKRQVSVQMGPGSNGNKTYVVAFIVKVTDRHGDAMEMATMVADKMDERGSDKRAPISARYASRRTEGMARRRTGRCRMVLQRGLLLH